MELRDTPGSPITIIGPPKNYVIGWPYPGFQCNKRLGKNEFMKINFGVLKAIGAIAIQLQWTAIEASTKPYISTNRGLAVEFYNALTLNLRRFCIEPLQTLQIAIRSYVDRRTKEGILKELFFFKNQMQFCHPSDQCGTVAEVLDYVWVQVFTAERKLSILYDTLFVENSNSTTDDPWNRDFPVRPPREILLEMALSHYERISTNDIRTIISGFRTAQDVEAVLDLSFNTPFLGPLFPSMEYIEGALVPKTIFACVHVDNQDPTKSKWILGSTAPRCDSFTWATEVCIQIRAQSLGDAHIAKIRQAQEQVLAMERSLIPLAGSPPDMLAVRRRVIATFTSDTSNLGLVSRSNDRGIAFDSMLRPQPPCYRCQVIHRYIQLAQEGFSQACLDRHLEVYDWKRRSTGPAHACAESVASLYCGTYEIQRGQLAHQ